MLIVYSIFLALISASIFGDLGISEDSPAVWSFLFPVPWRCSTLRPSKNANITSLLWSMLFRPKTQPSKNWKTVSTIPVDQTQVDKEGGIYSCKVLSCSRSSSIPANGEHKVASQVFLSHSRRRLSEGSLELLSPWGWWPIVQMYPLAVRPHVVHLTRYPLEHSPIPSVL